MIKHLITVYSKVWLQQSELQTITFNITYQTTLVKYFSLSYLKSPLKHPKVSFLSDKVISHWETMLIP